MANQNRGHLRDLKEHGAIALRRARPRDGLAAWPPGVRHICEGQLVAGPALEGHLSRNQDLVLEWS